MFNIANLSFVAPWALSALLILPLLWHLLKVTPPKPQIVKFPAVRLLQELTSEQILATKTPWWILLLRSLFVICLILAMAQPVWNAQTIQGKTDAPIVLVIDNDWSVIDRWPEHHDELKHLLDITARQNSPVLLVATANNDPLQFDDTETARQKSSTLRPQPWTSLRTSNLKRLQEALNTQEQPPHIYYISNGLHEQKDDTFINELNKLGELNILLGDYLRTPVVINKVTRSDTAFNVELVHAADLQERKVAINVIDDQGNTIYRQKSVIASQTTQTDTALTLPNEFRSKAHRLHVMGYSSPASQYLLDERWRDRPVGLISMGSKDNNLLSPTYYVHKGLRPYAPVKIDTLDNLLSRKLAILIDSGEAQLNDNQTATLEDWIKDGGIFIRFASERQSNAQASILSPVRVMPAERTLEGTLSWKQTTALAPFATHSPFKGLNVPEDIKIKKQILARPEANLHQKTWAQLKDGTPLITAKEIGQGWSVLFHITPIPGWSNLPLSGTFEMMLVRLLNLSAGNDLSTENKPLPPYRLFDGGGSLVPPYGETSDLAVSDILSKPPDHRTPPGLYGSSSFMKAYNLGPSIPTITPFDAMPKGVTLRGFNQNNETALAPWVLLLALGLLLIDWFLNLTVFHRKALTRAASLIITILSFTSTADAQTDWEKAIAAANQMRLAYMVTGDKKLDETSRRGLNGLSVILRRRTAVELAPSMAFNPEKDDPSLFPMIYWPVSNTQTTLSDEAATRLNTFMQTGGFILFDTMGKDNPSALARLNEQLNIASLRPVSNNHVLTRSFYLMQSFPGRFDHKKIWVEAAEDSSRDRVSSVLIGSNGWAQAWAKDDSLRPMYAVVPGGEVQREYAYRFGVNLVMYILSGNYKGDQVHLPAIMQRLGL